MTCFGRAFVLLVCVTTGSAVFASGASEDNGETITDYVERVELTVDCEKTSLGTKYDTPTTKSRDIDDNNYKIRWTSKVEWDRGKTEAMSVHSVENLGKNHVWFKWTPIGLEVKFPEIFKDEGEPSKVVYATKQFSEDVRDFYKEIGEIIFGDDVSHETDTYVRDDCQFGAAVRVLDRSGNILAFTVAYFEAKLFNIRFRSPFGTAIPLSGLPGADRWIENNPVAARAKGVSIKNIEGVRHLVVKGEDDFSFSAWDF